MISVRGQLGPRLGSGKDTLPKTVFQCADPGADRGLSDIHLVGGPLKRTGFDDRQEGARDFNINHSIFRFQASIKFVISI